MYEVSKKNKISGPESSKKLMILKVLRQNKISSRKKWLIILVIVKTNKQKTRKIKIKYFFL